MADDTDTTGGSTEDGTPNGTAAPATGPEQPNADATKPEQPATGDTGKDDDGEDWKGRSRTWEDRAKANKKAADQALADRDGLRSTLDALRKALDPDGGKDDDPQTVAERAIAERDANLAELRLLKVERGAERAARKAGADVDLLLDSRGFLSRLEKLDPSDDTFAEDVDAAVAEALKANPRLKAAAAAPPASATADMAGGGEQQSGPKSIDDIRAERRKRRAG